MKTPIVNTQMKYYKNIDEDDEFVSLLVNQKQESGLKTKNMWY